VTLLGGDAGEVDALITDRYLDTLLAAAPPGPVLAGASAHPEAVVSAGIRAASRRLAGDLPRFHPSFRFEERLAVRLAEMAAAMRLPAAAGADGRVVAFRPARPAPDPLRPLDPDGIGLSSFDAAAGGPAPDARPLLIGGAVAASALSLAGAWLAWRRRTSPMARAIRAAHELRRHDLRQPVGTRT